MSDYAIGIPGVNVYRCSDITVGSNQCFHAGCVTGQDIAFVVANINTILTFNADTFGRNLQGHRVGFSFFQRVATDDHACAPGKVHLLQQRSGEPFRLVGYDSPGNVTAFQLTENCDPAQLGTQARTYIEAIISKTVNACETVEADDVA